MTDRIFLRRGERIALIEGAGGRYSITDSGRIFSHVNRTRNVTFEIFGSKNPSGYMACHLFFDGKERTTPIHRLVARQFVDGFSPGLTVNHKDGNKLNNAASNLEWISQIENIKHAWRTGLMNPVIGEQHHASKVCPVKVRLIREMCASGKSQRHVAKEFHLRQSTVWGIVSKKTWSHVK